MNSKTIYFFSILVSTFSLLFISCNNLFPDSTYHNGNITISITVNKGSERTIMPTDITSKDVTKTELKIKLHRDENYLLTYTWNSISEMAECNTRQDI